MPDRPVYQNFKTISLGIISTVVFGYFAFQNFHWADLEKTVSTMSLWFMGGAGLFMVLAFNIRAYRWAFFLPKDQTYTYTSRLSGIAIGYFFSNILPGRLGDLVRPGYLAQSNKQPYKVCLYSIVIERVWDLVLFIMFGIFLLNVSPILHTEVLHINYFLLTALIVLGMTFLVFAKPALTACSNLSTKMKLNLLAKSIMEVVKAFDGNFKTRHSIYLFILTMGIFFVEGLFFVFIIWALHINISFVGSFLVMAIAALSHMLPAAPAGIGVFHYFCQLSLTMLGVGAEEALAAAIVIHAFIFIFDFLFAFFCYLKWPSRKKLQFA